MPRIPIFRLGGGPEKPAPPNLSASTPYISLEGISVGVDNLRHDVLLSARFVDQIRHHLMRLIAQNGNVSGILAAEEPEKATNNFLSAAVAAKAKPKTEPSDLKSLLASTLSGDAKAASEAAKVKSNAKQEH